MERLFNLTPTGKKVTGSSSTVIKLRAHAQLGRSSAASWQLREKFGEFVSAPLRRELVYPEQER